MKRLIIFSSVVLLCFGCEEKTEPTKAPEITNVAVSGITESSARCTFQLEPVGATQKAGIIYGLDAALQTGIVEISTNNVTNGYISLDIKALQSNTVYYYRTYASDKLQATVFSEIDWFKTNEPSDPEIIVTYLAPLGQTGRVEGYVSWGGLTASNVDQYAVIVMLHAVWFDGGGYFVKPYDNDYMNAIDATNGRFSVQITTGGMDVDINEVIIYFVKRSNITNANVANPTAMTGKYLASKTVIRSGWVNP